MKIFFSESNNDYASYTFNYAVYCIQESAQDIPAIYDQGFLPYSNDLSIPQEIYYLARSLRVQLSEFSDTSENRRVQRKLAPLDIQLEVIPKAAFQLDQPDFFRFCMNYAQARFSHAAMDAERLRYVLSRASANHLLHFTADGNTVAYVLAIIQDNTFHYWFAFFDTHLMENYPIGKWIMWRSIRWAKEQDLAYVYLGTCYGKSALYKARDFKGLSFFDGMQWNADIKLLKALCKSDDERKDKDRFKGLVAKSEVLAKLLKGSDDV